MPCFYLSMLVSACGAQISPKYSSCSARQNSTCPSVSTTMNHGTSVFNYLRTGSSIPLYMPVNVPVIQVILVCNVIHFDSEKQWKLSGECLIFMHVDIIILC